MHANREHIDQYIANLPLDDQLRQLRDQVTGNLIEDANITLREIIPLNINHGSHPRYWPLQKKRSLISCVCDLILSSKLVSLNNDFISQLTFKELKPFVIDMFFGENNDISNAFFAFGNALSNNRISEWNWENEVLCYRYAANFIYQSFLYSPATTNDPRWNVLNKIERNFISALTGITPQQIHYRDLRRALSELREAAYQRMIHAPSNEVGYHRIAFNESLRRFVENVAEIAASYCSNEEDGFDITLLSIGSNALNYASAFSDIDLALLFSQKNNLIQLHPIANFSTRARLFLTLFSHLFIFMGEEQKQDQHGNRIAGLVLEDGDMIRMRSWGAHRREEYNNSSPSELAACWSPSWQYITNENGPQIEHHRTAMLRAIPIYAFDEKEKFDGLYKIYQHELKKKWHKKKGHHFLYQQYSQTMLKAYMLENESDALRFTHWLITKGYQKTPTPDMDIKNKAIRPIVLWISYVASLLGMTIFSKETPPTIDNMLTFIRKKGNFSHEYIDKIEQVFNQLWLLKFFWEYKGVNTEYPRLINECINSLTETVPTILENIIKNPFSATHFYRNHWYSRLNMEIFSQQNERDISIRTFDMNNPYPYHDNSNRIKKYFFHGEVNQIITRFLEQDEYRQRYCVVYFQPSTSLRSNHSQYEDNETLSYGQTSADEENYHYLFKLFPENPWENFIMDELWAKIDGNGYVFQQLMLVNYNGAERPFSFIQANKAKNLAIDLNPLSQSTLSNSQFTHLFVKTLLTDIDIGCPSVSNKKYMIHGNIIYLLPADFPETNNLPSQAITKRMLYCLTQIKQKVDWESWAGFLLLDIERAVIDWREDMRTMAKVYTELLPNTEKTLDDKYFLIDDISIEVIDRWNTLKKLMDYCQGPENTPSYHFILYSIKPNLAPYYIHSFSYKSGNDDYIKRHKWVSKLMIQAPPEQIGKLHGFDYYCIQECYISFSTLTRGLYFSFDRADRCFRQFFIVYGVRDRSNLIDIPNSLSIEPEVTAHANACEPKFLIYRDFFLMEHTPFVIRKWASDELSGLERIYLEELIHSHSRHRWHAREQVTRWESRKHVNLMFDFFIHRKSNPEQQRKLFKGLALSQPSMIHFSYWNEYRSFCESLTPKRFKQILLSKNTHEIQIIDISHCVQLQLSCIVQIAKLCPNLRVLIAKNLTIPTLCDTPRWSNGWSKKTPLYFHSLEILDLRDNPHLTFVSISGPNIRKPKLDTHVLFKPFKGQTDENIIHHTSSFSL